MIHYLYRRYCCRFLLSRKVQLLLLEPINRCPPGDTAPWFRNSRPRRYFGSGQRNLIAARRFRKRITDEPSSPHCHFHGHPPRREDEVLSIPFLAVPFSSLVPEFEPPRKEKELVVASKVTWAKNFGLLAAVLVA